ncbi:MAG TPA: lysozyme inhibitor LprI family protein [Chroococcidiopsis sp.]
MVKRGISWLGTTVLGLSMAIAPALAQDADPSLESPTEPPIERVRLVIPTLPPSLQLEAATPAEIPGVARPYCFDQGQFSLNACAVRWAETSEFLRSQISTDFAQQFDENMQIEFAVIERLWSDFRDLHCGAMTSPFMGSSSYRMLYHNCVATVTNDRIADIQQWGTPTAPAIQSRYRLQAILRFFDITALPAQRQWERYQTRHCRFEAQLFGDRPDQERQCYHRLTESRILQLQGWSALR